MKKGNHLRTKFARIIPILGIIVSLAACSGQHRRAMQHLDKGEYDAALEEFSHLLQENPRDSRALEGIRRSQAGVISGRLLSVRFARLGGNNEQALEMLRQIVADEKKWGVYPSGAVFSTQRAETEEGIHHFSDTIDSYLADQHPLAARLYFEKYRDIFWQDDLTPNVGPLLS